ncbi:hypothetical protein ACQ4M4_23230 [Leptolyngbya sp. AN02str]|uniref:hypothetical protein n=1 Tax=Leptolyngbya sp. AN02str TaxID=3423363 RepID=UPI003D313D87
MGIEHTRSQGNSPLAQWFHKTVDLESVRVQFRLRGNILHILCEGYPSPDLTLVLSQLLPALKGVDLNTLIPPNQPKIYQLFVYGRRPGHGKPDWTAPIDLNQLDYHLELLKHAQADMTQASRVLVGLGASAAPVTSNDGPPLPGANYARVKPPHVPQRPNTSAIQLSNFSLAKQGNTDAIARYLSETLSALGVAVQVSAKTIPYRPTATATVVAAAAAPAESLRRLWIVCDATYSPDPTLIAEPIAQRLRNLELEKVRDAIVIVQVRGELQPDWRLRVDLTPTEEMLRELARWGDVQAITRLLDHALNPEGMAIATASLKEATLHLFCGYRIEPDYAPKEGAPEQEAVRTLIAPLLDAIAPQGIEAATLYGQVPDADEPAWVMWLNLPAHEHTALADTAITLARQGDWAAIAFLLNRLLNPDLDRQLATGGIRLQLLPKVDPLAMRANSSGEQQYVLHIMTDAPICPDQKQVGKTAIKFLQDLRLSNVSGIRVYGRRAGQKRPLWTEGVDLVSRRSGGTEVAPEFAAAEAFMGDLLSSTTELALPDEASEGQIEQSWQQNLERWKQSTQHWLVRSQLFVNDEAASAASPATAGTSDRQATWKLALIWGAAGLLLALQIDWGLGRVMQPPPDDAVAAEVPSPMPTATIPASPTADVLPEAVPGGTRDDLDSMADEPSTTEEPTAAATPAASPLASGSPTASPTASPTDALPNLELNRSGRDRTQVFDETGFTQADEPSASPGSEPSSNPTAVASPSADQPATNQPTAERSPLPSPTSPTAAPAASPSPTALVEPPAANELPYSVPNPRLQAITTAILSAEPSLPTFNTRLLDEKYMLYRDRLLQYGPVDVLIVGSSRALRGIDPAALQQELTKLGYADVSIFNYAINGATAQVVDLTLRQILRPNELPKLVIWADGARAFNSGSVDVTYNGVMVSEGYRELVASRRVDGSGEAVVAEPSMDSAQPQGIGESLNQSYQAIDRAMSDRLGQISAAHSYRDRLKTLVRNVFGVFSPLINSSTAAKPFPNAVQSLSDQGRDMIDFDGFLPLALKFNPATYYQEYARVEGRYDGDYTDFRIEGAQEQAFESLLSFTSDRQIPVVFINLPLTDEYLDTSRRQHEQTFRQYMLQQAAEQPGFVFRDLSDVWLSNYDYFSDPSHLNRYGAYEISRRIAQDPLIPWADAAAPAAKTPSPVQAQP